MFTSNNSNIKIRRETGRKINQSFHCIGGGFKKFEIIGKEKLCNSLKTLNYILNNIIVLFGM